MTDPLLYIEARIQDRLVDFLALKKPLVEMTAYPNADIAQKATGFLSMQTSLEDRLSEVLTAIQNFKNNGTIDYLAIPDYGIFIYGMEKQITEVHALMSQAGYKVPTNWTPIFVLGGMGLLALMLLKR